MIALLDNGQDLPTCETEIGEPVGQLLTPLTRYRLRDPLQIQPDESVAAWRHRLAGEFILACIGPEGGFLIQENPIAYAMFGAIRRGLAIIIEPHHLADLKRGQEPDLRAMVQALPVDKLAAGFEAFMEPFVKD